MGLRDPFFFRTSVFFLQNRTVTQTTGSLSEKTPPRLAGEGLSMLQKSPFFAHSSKESPIKPFFSCPSRNQVPFPTEQYSTIPPPVYFVNLPSGWSSFFQTSRPDFRTVDPPRLAWDPPPVRPLPFFFLADCLRNDTLDGARIVSLEAPLKAPPTTNAFEAIGTPLCVF